MLATIPPCFGGGVIAKRGGWKSFFDAPYGFDAIFEKVIRRAMVIVQNLRIDGD